MKSSLKWVACALCVGMFGMNLIAAETGKSAAAGKAAVKQNSAVTINTATKASPGDAKNPAAAIPTGATQWLRDFDEAKRQAKQSGRPIIANVTGSDWCPYCIKLEKEVFSQQAFKDYAKENLILFIADFPRKKQLPPAEVKQNTELKNKYEVKGFPSVLLLDAEGAKLGKTGYTSAPVDKYVQNLKAMLTKGAAKK